MSVALADSPYLPTEAEVVERVEETRDIFTLRLRLTDPDARAGYAFAPGQFNMVYLFGVGEVAISIVSDPKDEELLDHTIRVLGRVTRGLGQLAAGDRLGIRGPYGRGWPLEAARGRDVVIVTGGLGCAPVVAAINYILRRRGDYGHLTIVQGVKHADDLIWRARYEEWAGRGDVDVLLAADRGAAHWPWHVGLVTELLDDVPATDGAITMMCGPEVMMQAAARKLGGRGFADADMYLSMERNMQCAIGHCGHCQFGAPFVCREGPVFPYAELAPLLGTRGY